MEGLEKFSMGYIGFTLVWMFTLMFASPLLPEETTSTTWFKVLTLAPATPIFVVALGIGLAISVKYMVQGAREVLS